MATRNELISAARDISLLDSDDISDASVTVLLNRAMRYIGGMPVDWPFLRTSGTIEWVADQAAYSLPTDFNAMVSVVRTGESVRLREVSEDDFHTQYGDGDTTASNPWGYFLRDDTLVAVPTPSVSSGGVTIYYKKRIDVLDSPTSTPEFDSLFHEIIVEWALWKLLQREEHYTRSQQHREEFFALLSHMRNFYGDRHESGQWALGRGQITSKLTQPIRYEWQY